MAIHSESNLKTIMLATDLSPASYGALDYARVPEKDLAQSFTLNRSRQEILFPQTSQAPNLPERRAFLVPTNHDPRSLVVCL